MSGGIRELLEGVAAGIVILLALSVVVFDLVFSWFGPPADPFLAAVWFLYEIPGNLAFLFADAYAAGYLGPFHLHRPRSRPKPP